MHMHTWQEYDSYPLNPQETKNDGPGRTDVLLQINVGFIIFLQKLVYWVFFTEISNLTSKLTSNDPVTRKN